ncbi:carbohydrate ABC transporter permease [Chelativorans sp. AA-79]|uniref:carbohydrate ABC transporter permease n=1 Tax=Chelativorans sp. AA-79 TaxID=3028735 RepID=UPI0023F69F6E|nr:carbohydrate ABC transporter permease [Chelativorans sp. AA-79]WEX09822.1 carbohydrate ABC transporter permease [Chelativorans sp. AA-79]
MSNEETFPSSAALGASSSRTDAWQRSGKVVQMAAIGFALVWSLAPVYWMLSTSLKTELEATRLDPTLWPHEPTLANYIGLGGGTLPFVSFFFNTVVSCFLTALIAVVVATPAAYALSRAQFRLRTSIGYTVLIVRMLPMIVLLAPLYLLLLNAQLLDSLSGLVVGFTTFGLPFAVWMMKSFIDAVPIEVEEAARVDGYPRWQVLLRVVVPLVFPGILTTGTFVFMEAWNNLIYPLTFITSLDKQTLPAALVLTFTGQFKTDWGGMMAAATITTLPLMIAFFAVQRSMVRGLTSGAVAGA